ncbi:protein FAF-like, chloroplastic [Phalaenopsis equestris]|uniref:protein FAF-like, chloroplastic n=1 Tax=Phalaenopsis equestris TaxID=78828 RepID=UPI0009E3BEF5|nr:protein FAF-like, chloroplastic [Phalaenopsis equestris]
MSVTVCRAALVASSWLSEMVKPPQPTKSAMESEVMAEKKRFNIRNSIQTNEENNTSALPPPYIHPLVRRSAILMSQNSLEICTETLGSETGSDEFTSCDELDSCIKTENVNEEAEDENELQNMQTEKKDLSYVNYHRSIGRRSQLRTFPPPLPSISRRNGPCFKLQPHRRDGRLVVEAVPVSSVNYLQAERRGGRLVLSFIDSSPRKNSTFPTPVQQSEQNIDVEIERGVMMEEEQEEDEEEEVEVLDRGTIVEVKVSKQAAAKPHRSSLVINKFVVGSRVAEYISPVTEMEKAAAAVAAAAVSTLTSTTEGFRFNYLSERQNRRWGTHSTSAAAATEAKLLFTSRRRNREELLHDMRRCSELRRPLFIFEQPPCIAT